MRSRIRTLSVSRIKTERKMSNGVCCVWAGPGPGGLWVRGDGQAEGPDGRPGSVCRGGIRGHHASQDRSG